MRSAVIVKLGGSAITDKSRECTPNLSVLGRAVDELADYPGPLVVLHGGGSYAHPIVTRAGLDKRYKGGSQKRSISETEFFLDQLTRIVGVSLMRRGRDFVCFRPMSFMILDKGRIGQALLHPIMKALELGLTPVIHGDLVFDKTNGVSVVSADRIASLLSERLQNRGVIFGCNVDGVFTEDPKVSHKAVLIERISKVRTPYFEDRSEAADFYHGRKKSFRNSEIPSRRQAQPRQSNAGYSSDRTSGPWQSEDISWPPLYSPTRPEF